MPSTIPALIKEYYDPKDVEVLGFGKEASFELPKELMEKMISGDSVPAVRKGPLRRPIMSDERVAKRSKVDQDNRTTDKLVNCLDRFRALVNAADWAHAAWSSATKAAQPLFGKRLKSLVRQLHDEHSLLCRLCRQLRIHPNAVAYPNEMAFAMYDRDLIDTDKQQNDDHEIFAWDSDHDLDQDFGSSRQGSPIPAYRTLTPPPPANE